MSDSQEAEIARLRTAARDLRDLLAQQRRATEAEAAARAMAEADNEKLRWALDGTTRMLSERSDNNSRGMRWMRALVEANQRVLATPHPGAALLIELDAARAVVAAMRQIDRHVIGAHALSWDAMPEPCDECGEMREIAAQALASYDKATKGSAS